ncbi:S41 family peptidase [Jeotgalibacillus proteolyticus]|uniref:Peptidase S41 n=1 Tax=Jeotgalibacillus proteolyticus TaxID=2082395 RepID=A0A2S5GE47_9BACL|nr:S41 family peptidase [Jeotgalibacillus proteolyticus]PPA71191.1 peptidase S41 [Jeotgalibacillus proteolyticus]
MDNESNDQKHDGQDPAKEREHEVEEAKETLSKYVNIKKFHFVMLLFITVLFTAVFSVFVLSFGDEKAVTVGIPERAEFNKLYEAYDAINEGYFMDTNEEDLVNGAINGMIDALGDPYSDYMNQEEAAQFTENISSSFQGIGAEIQSLNGVVTVVSPIKGSPAERAGILPNDQILEVDEDSIQGMSANEAVMLIRGEKGTDVTLTIQRPGMQDTMDITITRDDIPIDTVYYEMDDNNVASIQLTSFSEHTYEELTKAIEELEGQGMEAMILDMRQNPGGVLQQAISIADLFVPEGETIVQIEEKSGDKQVIAAQGGKKIDIPAAVLIDEGSASASEIVAAAMNEAGDIPIFGKTSFGKGTVQTAESFSDQSNMKFTTARWLTPEGNWIHEEGIKPTTEVNLPDFASLPFLDIDVDLEESMVSEQVKTAESMLEAIGIDPGEADGLFDEETKAAVEKLQDENDLEVTGIIDGETATVLMTAVRDELQENDPQVKAAEEFLMDEAGISSDQPAEDEEDDAA